MNGRSAFYYLSSLLVGLIFFLLAIFTTDSYILVRGLGYLDTYQLERHINIIEGKAGNPWQYRVLSAYIVEGLIKLLQALGVPSPHVLVFIGLRYIQDSTIFFVAYLYYQKSGISFYSSMIGIMILAWSMSYSHYDSDLQFNTFFDVIFYLLAGLSIISQKPLFIPPITFFAALNRETSGFIPFMCIFAALFVYPKKLRARSVIIGIISVFIYTLTFFSLRIAYGEQFLITFYGNYPGLPILRYNVFRAITWWQLLATLGVIPFISLLGYSKWNAYLRVFFWVVVPIWFVIHLVAAVMAETRLFLVPQALVFIPGSLILIQQSHSEYFSVIRRSSADLD